MGAGTGETAGIGALAGLAAVTILSGGAALPLALGAGATLGAAGGAVKERSDTGHLSDIGGANYAAGEAKTAANNQATQTAQLQQTLLSQPKQVSPDNFLSMKANQLANLRLGIASTITNQSGTLSSPSLTGNYPGKAKLGQ